MRKKRNKKPSAQANPAPPNFPDSGYRVIPCPPLGQAHVQWCPDPKNRASLSVDFHWEWTEEPKKHEGQPMNDDPRKALTRAINAIADRSPTTARFWREYVFDDLAI